VKKLITTKQQARRDAFRQKTDCLIYKNFRLILIASNRVVDRIKNNGHSTLIHCSDGWDRTAQLAAVSQLCLDGYYRTLEGFLVLIDKEWCAFGHKFQDRIGHTVNKPQDTERSPVFIQVSIFFF
jgi:myotubularin-related protein 1/2